MPFPVDIQNINLGEPSSHTLIMDIQEALKFGKHGWIDKPVECFQQGVGYIGTPALTMGDPTAGGAARWELDFGEGMYWSTWLFGDYVRSARIVGITTGSCVVSCFLHPITASGNIGAAVAETLSVAGLSGFDFRATVTPGTEFAGTGAVVRVQAGGPDGTARIYRAALERARI